MEATARVLERELVLRLAGVGHPGLARAADGVALVLGGLRTTGRLTGLEVGALGHWLAQARALAVEAEARALTGNLLVRGTITLADALTLLTDMLVDLGAERGRAGAEAQALVTRLRESA